MARDQSKRLTPVVLTEDEAAFNALQSVTGYTPSNPAHTITALSQAVNEMRAAQAAEDQAAAAAAAARDKAVAEEWEFHNVILGAKDQAKAQFGKDSVEVQALGLKRTSEYKNRKTKKNDTPK